MKKFQFFGCRFFGKIVLWVVGLCLTTNLSAQKTGEEVTGLEAGCFSAAVTGHDDVSDCKEETMDGGVTFGIAYAFQATDCNCSSNSATMSFVLKDKDGNAFNPESFTGFPTSIEFKNLKEGKYTLTISISTGNCTSSAMAEIKTPPPPELTGTVTNVKCNGGSNGAIDITATGGGGPPYNYKWNDGPTTGDRTGLDDGTYFVTVTASNTECSADTSFTVLEPLLPIGALPTIKDACNGKNNGEIKILVIGGTPGTSGYSYQWTNNLSTTDLIKDLPPGKYSVTVGDSNGCTAEKKDIEVKEITASNLGYTVSASSPIKSGASTKIVFKSANVDVRYHWQAFEVSPNVTNITTSIGNDIQKNQDSINIPLEIDDTDLRSPGAVTFQVHSFDKNNSNCTGDTQYVSVIVLPNLSSDDAPFIPEIYTPNGDGQNDTWQVALPGNVPGQFTIFNRLGGKVYTGDTATAWDGNGCPDGPYFYVLRYKPDGQEEKVVKGAVTILRTTD